MIYRSDLEQAIELKKENKQKLHKLKKKKKKMVDNLFHSLHEEVFEEIDCLKCANCCKTTSPIFRDIDVKRISKHFKMKEKDFINQYLMMDEDQDWVLKSSPCFFLNEDDNKCDIYDVRPNACREYPHTDRKNIQGIFNLTLKNTEICPAVARVMDKIDV